MKRYLVLIALAAFTIGLNGCAPEPPEPQDPVEQRLALISGTWSYKDVVNDGVRQAGWEQFKLNISGTFGDANYKFLTTGRPAGTLTPWPSSGTWTFKEKYLTSILRGDIVDIDYLLSDDGKTLEMVFYYQGEGFRTNGLKGGWVFTFTRGQNSI